VFTSLRDGDAEIYSAVLNADLTLGAQTRLTTEYGNDVQPALSPSGTTIAFVSGRDGAPRVWLMDANGANPRALETGSADYVPEQAPRWSPDGGTIAFSSTRTGSSQIFIVAATGGTATQLSHETLGAFAPSWRADGKSVLYTSLSGEPHVMSAPVAGGAATVFATDASGIGEASCTAVLCLAVIDPLGSAGRIAALTTGGRAAANVVPQVADDHSPAPRAP
jgi:TolB protein